MLNNRYTGESIRLIYYIIEIARLRKLEGFLVTMDIEKTFSSLDHNIHQIIIKTHYTKKTFALVKILFYGWVKVLLRDQEQCVINDGKEC